jgi:murein L,D-transpeptidase YafK
VLGLYVGGRLAATYRIALGRRAEGHKEREGDGRTPEGHYFVCTRNPRSRFHLFLGISYPNADDAALGLARGAISEAEHRAIVEATAAGRQPPWNTALGGEIGIHGGGVWADWTLGCIATENSAVEELWEVLRIGDPVIVAP